MKNGDQNSLVAFARQLFESLFVDLKRFYPELVGDLDRDLATVRDRLTCEGLGFVTKTLPRLGKEFDLALLERNPLRFTGLTRSGRTAFPAFMRGLLGLVFDKTTGRVLDAPFTPAINDLRQFYYIVYKLEVPYESSLVDARVASFVLCDTSLPTSSGSLCASEQRILSVARALLSTLFEGFNPLDIVPSHGPGEVATGEKPSEKFYNLKRRHEAIDQLYPFEEYFLASFSHFVDTAKDNVLDGVEDVPKGLEYSTLTAVPKDSRGPRLIAMEPLEYMWIQQGLKAKLYDWIESHDLTKGHVNFTNQKVNRELALASSTCMSNVTLDMSDASDRVSLWLIEELFSGTPLLEPLMATRSSRVKLPKGDFLVYKKFAPMGSALCFPIEALTFWSLAVACMHVVEGVPLLLASKLVWVYGDDIICRRGLELSLFAHFPSFGLKFNEAKCCTTGRFRESCGMDAFAGESVTPIRVKALPPRNVNNANSIVAFVAQSNLFWQRGFYTTANYLKTIVEKIVGELPVVTLSDKDGNPAPTGFLSFYSRVGYKETRRRRWSKDLQRVAYKSLVPHAKSESISSDNWCELLRSLITRGSEFPRAGIYPKRYTVVLRSTWDDKPHPSLPGGLNCNFSSIGCSEPIHLERWHSGCTLPADIRIGSESGPEYLARQANTRRTEKPPLRRQGRRLEMPCNTRHKRELG